MTIAGPDDAGGTNETWLTARSLSGLKGVRHGFFGRRGGRSQGVFAGLNVGIRNGDEASAVEANRARVAGHMGFSPASLTTARQVHGVRCVRVDTPWPASAAPDADALITDRPGLLLGVLTADCAPILLADPATGIVGAAHAGWRGALAGVLEAVMLGMVEAGAMAARIVAAVGPCIGQVSYEVAPEFEAEFLAHDGASARFFATAFAGARPHFDLAGYCAWRLERAGAAWVEVIGRDTCAEPAMFFSHRRSSKTDEPRHGLQISVIGCPS